MTKIMDKEYLTTEEASKRYGLSKEWFMRERMLGTGPRYKRLRERGKAFYPKEETDKWFIENLKECE